jgi:processive 1,2-diacylglycerol beta-glucosyltransferase
MGAKVLVLSAAVGAGHLRAAEAVELALRVQNPTAEVKNVDVLSLTNAAFRKVYGESYLDLVNKAPYVLGYFYDMLDRPRRLNSKRDRLRLLVEKANLTKCTDLIVDGGWDLAVCTHFLPAEIIASLRRNGKLRLPQVTATTDFETHRLWVNQPCDRYTTATDEGSVNLQHWGVPAADVVVTGIPIHPIFAEPKDRVTCKRAHDLAEDRPVVLQLAGGFGVGPIEALFQGVLSIERPLQAVVVTGRNEAAKEQIEKIPVPDRHRVKVIGFTKQIDEFMAAADIVLSKPGGLTTSEVLARGAAMAVVNPIPGQESRNSDFLLENGAAIKINNIDTMPAKLTQLLDNPVRLNSLKANALKLAKPRAAFDVAKLALSLV